MKFGEPASNKCKTADDCAAEEAQFTTFKFHCPPCPHIIVELDENLPVAKHRLLLVSNKFEKV
jgi:hypothetical protein